MKWIGLTFSALLNYLARLQVSWLLWAVPLRFKGSALTEQSPALRALCRETLNHLYQSTGLQPRAYSEEEWEKLEGYYMRAKPAEFLEYRIVWEK